MNHQRYYPSNVFQVPETEAQWQPEKNANPTENPMPIETEVDEDYGLDQIKDTKRSHSYPQSEPACLGQKWHERPNECG